MKAKILGLLALGLLTGSTAANALVIYTISATVYGSVGTTSFSNAVMTFVGTADDSIGVTSCGPDCIYNMLSGATIKVEGVGTGTLSHTPYVFRSGYDVGYGDQEIGDFLYLFSLSFAAHHLGSNFGPVAGFVFARGQGPLATSLGDISLTAISTTPGRFQTTVTAPEPGTLGLLGLCLAGLSFTHRRKPS